MQLGLEVVDVALGDGQLVLSVLQSGASVIKVVGHDVMTAISPH
jgi:ubiquinone/menaquinone biosynthesis C-methylase UbiE